MIPIDYEFLFVSAILFHHLVWQSVAHSAVSILGMLILILGCGIVCFFQIITAHLYYGTVLVHMQGFFHM